MRLSSVGLHQPIEYTLTALIPATELITRYYSNEQLAQCCFNVTPTSVTLADFKPTLFWWLCRAGWESSYCQYAGGLQIPTVTQPFVSQHKAHMREMLNYFLIDVAQVYRVYMTWKLALNAAMGMKRICDPIWQNETEVAFWGIGVIIRSWISTKLPLKWGVTQACRLNSSKDVTQAKSENINLKIVSFWENGVQRWRKFFLKFFLNPYSISCMRMSF